jgi:hypothetical protein
VAVKQTFSRLLKNLSLTRKEIETGTAACRGVSATLHGHYYGSYQKSNYTKLTGSWARETQSRPRGDVDILFELPRYLARKYKSGNKQSKLLQDVKQVLIRDFPDTDVKGDGPTVIVPFPDYTVEICPAFRIGEDKYNICITKDGGRFKAFCPGAELHSFRQSCYQTDGSTRDLIIILKRWNRQCRVRFKSFCIELLVIDFFREYKPRSLSLRCYDRVLRDFFEWLNRKSLSNVNYLTVPGTGEQIDIGNTWRRKVRSAFVASRNAFDYKKAGFPSSAYALWRELFGDYFPPQRLARLTRLPTDE